MGKVTVEYYLTQGGFRAIELDEEQVQDRERLEKLLVGRRRRVKLKSIKRIYPSKEKRSDK